MTDDKTKEVSLELPDEITEITTGSLKEGLDKFLGRFAFNVRLAVLESIGEIFKRAKEKSAPSEGLTWESLEALITQLKQAEPKIISALKSAEIRGL